MENIELLIVDLKSDIKSLIESCENISSIYSNINLDNLIIFYLHKDSNVDSEIKEFLISVDEEWNDLKDKYNYISENINKIKEKIINIKENKNIKNIILNDSSLIEINILLTILISRINIANNEASLLNNLQKELNINQENNIIKYIRNIIILKLSSCGLYIKLLKEIKNTIHLITE